MGTEWKPDDVVAIRVTLGSRTVAAPEWWLVNTHSSDDLDLSVWADPVTLEVSADGIAPWIGGEEVEALGRLVHAAWRELGEFPVAGDPLYVALEALAPLIKRMGWEEGTSYYVLDDDSMRIQRRDD